MRIHSLLTIILMVAATGVLFGQGNKASVYADTLHISGDEDYRMMIVSENISRYEPADTLDRLMDALVEDLMSIEWPETRNRFLKIYYTTNKQGNATLRFKDVTGEDRQWTVLENGETLPPASIQLIIPRESHTQLHFYLNDILDVEKLTSKPLRETIAEVLEKQRKTNPVIKRVATTAVWELENGRPKEMPSQSYRNTIISDQIELSGSVGISLIRNLLVPNISLLAGVSLADKVRLKHMANVELSMNYIFNEMPEGGFNTDINTFIGANYYLNLSKDRDNPNWYGLGISYLAWRNGNFFDEDTWRLSLGVKFGKGYSIKPEFYFGDNFKNVMPGLRLKVSF